MRGTWNPTPHCDGCHSMKHGWKQNHRHGNHCIACLKEDCRQCFLDGRIPTPPDAVRPQVSA